MKKHYTALFAFLALTPLAAQTAFWTEDFGTGCSRGQTPTAFASINGNWTEAASGANDTHADMWFVSATAAGTGGGNCSDNCIVNSTANRSLHIGNAAVYIPSIANIGADTGSTYLTGVFCSVNICSTTHKRVMSPLINCLGKSNIVVAFTYYEGGEAADDDATLVYSPDGGATWTTIDPLAKTAVGPCPLPGASWVEYSVSLPASADNNANVKIGFNWTNDNDGQGGDPSFAVDDIALLQAPQGIPETSVENIRIYAASENEIVVDARGNNFRLVSVTDLAGRVIGATVQDNRIQTGPLGSGVYFVTIESSGLRITRKIAVAH